MPHCWKSHVAAQLLYLRGHRQEFPNYDDFISLNTVLNITNLQTLMNFGVCGVSSRVFSAYQSTRLRTVCK